MNERIRQLADEANKGLKNGHLNFSEGLMLYSEKFAELIVQECAEICLEANDHKNILRHFGLSSTADSQRPAPVDSSYPDGDGYWK